jgi:hypothetical protein
MRFRTFVPAALLALASCERGTPSTPVEAVPTSAALRLVATADTVRSATPGFEAPMVGVRVVDAAGGGMDGVTVSLRIVQGGGTLASPTAASTNGGYVGVVYTPGNRVERATIEVSATGAAPVRYHIDMQPTRGPLWLHPRVDSLVLGTENCRGAFTAFVGDSASSLGLQIPSVIEDTLIAGVFQSQDRSGNYRGRTPVIYARRQGRTRMFTSFGTLVDTLVIRVAEPQSFTIRVSPPRVMELGSTLTLQPLALSACGEMTPRPTFTFASSNPQVATVDAAGVITPHTVGTSTFTVSAPGLRDASAQIQFIHRHLLVPADTPTIMVGDTVRYRLTVVDGAGVMRPVADAVYSASPGLPWEPLAISLDRSGLATGLVPGNVRIVAYSPEYRDVWRAGWLKVVARP